MPPLSATSRRPLDQLTTRTALPVESTVAVQVAWLLTQWSERRRTRRELADLPPHLLRDIGMTQEAARAEAAKPFWRA